MFKKSDKTFENEKDVTKTFVVPGAELEAARFKSVGSVVQEMLKKLLIAADFWRSLKRLIYRFRPILECF